MQKAFMVMVRMMCVCRWRGAIDSTFFVLCLFLSLWSYSLQIRVVVVVHNLSLSQNIVKPFIYFSYSFVIYRAL